MYSLVKYFLIFIFCVIISEYQVDSGRETSLSRRKRYVVFPEGSTFSIALCLTIHTLTPDDIFTEGVNWGISYDLPNETKPALDPFLQLRHDKIKPGNKYAGFKNNIQMDKNDPLKYSDWNNYNKYYFKPGKKKYSKSDYYYVQRRHRRDLYNKLEVILNAMNFDGRTCILRALCEASQRLMPKGNTLIEEMIRISFSFPLKKIFSFEPEEHHTYSKAHNAGHEGQDCANIFSGCSFSLIDLALGKYDALRTQPTVQFPVESPETGGIERSSGKLHIYNMKSAPGLLSKAGQILPQTLLWLPAEQHCANHLLGFYDAYLPLFHTMLSQLIKS